MNVHLRNFVAFTRSGITYVHSHPGHSAGPDLCRVYLQVFKFEGCVTQSVTKREERLTRAECIAAVGGGLVIVVIRKIADRMRKSYGQFSARGNVSKQNICCRGSAFLPQVPAFKYRSNMFGDVVD